MGPLWRAACASGVLALACTETPARRDAPASGSGLPATPAPPPPQAQAPVPPPAPLPELPEDPNFEAFGEAQLKGCQLAGSYDGSTRDMSLRAGSEASCHWRLGRAALERLPASELGRWSVKPGRPGTPWNEDWEQLALLTSDFSILDEFAEGSFFGGGTLLQVMVPAHGAGVALEATYALQHSGSEELARRVKQRAPFGAVVRASMPRWAQRARHYLPLVPDVPSFSSPATLQLLVGGDWRRLERQVTALQGTVERLSVALCNEALSARLGGETACRDTAQSYLYAEIGGPFDEAVDAPPFSEGTAPLPPGVDTAYEPTVAAAYEGCSEATCLARKARQRFDAAVKDAEVKKDFLALERTFCDLEASPALDTEGGYTVRHLSDDSCSAVAELRAAFFLERWTNRRGELDAHRAFRREWGKRVAGRLALWRAHLMAQQEAARGQKDRPRWEPKVEDFGSALAALERLPKAAGTLAARLCAAPATGDAPTCTRELTEYWLSYSYVVGLRWEEE